MIIGPKLAYEDEITYPRFKTIRPATSGRGGSNNNGRIKLSDIRNLSQDDPDTVPPTSLSIKMFNNDLSTYTPISGGFKTVVKLATPVSDSDTNYVNLELPPTTISAPNLAVGGFDFIRTSGTIGLGWTLGGKFRIRSVTQDFDMTLATWNVWETSPPIFGTGSMNFDGDLFYSETNIGSFAIGQSGSISINGLFSFIPNLAVVGSVYGYYIDMQFAFSRTSSVIDISNIAMSLDYDTSLSLSGVTWQS